MAYQDDSIIEVPADRVRVSTEGPDFVTLELVGENGFSVTHRIKFTPRQSVTLIRHIAFDLDGVLARLVNR